MVSEQENETCSLTFLFMKNARSIVLLVCLVLVGGNSLTGQLLTHWESRTPMPVKRSNLAAASMEIGDTTWIFTFMGIDSTKLWSGIQLDAWKYNTRSDRWYRIADVPDTEGRIAASATAFDGRIYLIGGYKVYAGGNEYTSPRVDIYDPATDSWSQGDSVPIPTDDHVQVSFRDSLFYLVSGWSQNTNTRQVQIYDPVQDSWSSAGNIGGPGLFGHAGAISGDTILYLDGVRISGGSFVLENKVWRGVINPANPNSVVWTNLGAHPGPKVYRGAGFAYRHRMIFTGGTANAYNIDGIGYNGNPSLESGRTFGYNLVTEQWEEYARNPDSVMDVRQVVQVGDNQFYVIGGMAAGQTVTHSVSVFVVDSVLAGRAEEVLPASGWQWVTLDPQGWWQLVPNQPVAGAQVRLTDLSGRVLEGTCKVQSGGTIEIELTGYPAGLYLLSLQAENGVPFWAKLLKF